MVESLISLVIYLIVIGCVLALLIYLVDASPMPEPYKGWVRFAVIAIAVIILIFVLLSIIPGGPPPLRVR